jgi:hypothetical protein
MREQLRAPPMHAKHNELMIFCCRHMRDLFNIDEYRQIIKFVLTSQSSMAPNT